jgi:rod shape-determining protein MreC
LLVNDQTSGVGVVLGKSRLQGILKGTPSGGLVVDKILSDESVQPGEEVVTSGGDQIFPKGLKVGVVSRTKVSDTFLTITLNPAANLAKLEEVLVVTQVETRTPTLAESGGRLRAADILAERLPSVPPKPAGDAAKLNAADAVKTAGSTTKPAAAATQSPKVASTEETPKVQPQKAATAQVPPASGNKGSAPADAAGNENRARAVPNSNKPGNSSVIPTATGTAKPSLVTKPKTTSSPLPLTSKPESAVPAKSTPVQAPPEDEPQ